MDVNKTEAIVSLITAIDTTKNPDFKDLGIKFLDDFLPDESKNMLKKVNGLEGISK